MRSLFILASVFSASLCWGQNARDYFLPVAGFNSLEFKMRDPGQKKKFCHNETTYFVDMKDSVRMTTMFFREDTIRGGHEQVLKITDSEILVVSGKANTSPGRVETYSSDGMIVFKLPPAKGQSEWSGLRDKGAVKTIYRSEFATIKVDGKKVRAVKVSNIQKRRHSGEEYVFYVDYYVAGIGRYKRTTENGQELEVLARQTYDPKVPVVN